MVRVLTSVFLGLVGLHGRRDQAVGSQIPSDLERERCVIVGGWFWGVAMDGISEFATRAYGAGRT